ncbi:hypothetical protein U5B43_08815 [Campylobacter sp. 9BO]|uniref:gp53 minor capsid family protein n=1 Tax=Campylobacter sp. 9BO TaxID=3424759 RepID=UPI003D32E89B
MSYLDKKAYAGQIARGGESPYISKAYTNLSEGVIDFGVFVAVRGARGVTTLSKATDNIAGVTPKLGTKSENAKGDIVSVFSVAHGSEIWVQGKDEHGLNIGDEIQIEATAGADAGKVAKAATLAVTAAKGKFYAVDVLGNLIKITRKEA